MGSIRVVALYHIDRLLFADRAVDQLKSVQARDEKLTHPINQVERFQEFPQQSEFPPNSPEVQAIARDPPNSKLISFGV